MGWLKPRPERDCTQEHTFAPVTTLQRRTLAERLEAGRLSAGEALRMAMEVAQALRQLHDEGRAHGALTPFAIELTPSGIELIAPVTPRGVPTPYTAPEVLKGQPADWRADIFSFGAIVHEMITGRWPFEGDTPELLQVALQNAATPQTGHPAVDSLLRHCLAKDPAARCQRMQRIQMELRLASVASRRTDVLDRRSGEHAASAATQLHALEQTVRAQAAALDAIRNALAQTDDLVERVVETLDFLQSTVMERSEFLQGTMNAPTGRVVRPISG